jgi:hypothetical protein
MNSEHAVETVQSASPNAVHNARGDRGEAMDGEPVSHKRSS